MMGSRKKLIAKIAKTESKLIHQRAEVMAHEAYFLKLMRVNKVLLIALALPLFFWGWRQEKMVGVRHATKQLIIKKSITATVAKVLSLLL